MKTRITIVVVALLGATWAILGCIVTSNAYTCENPDPNHLGPDGLPDPCHYSDDGGTDARNAADVDYANDDAGDAADDAGDGG